MPFETLKRSHLKRNIIIGVVAVLIISAIILNFTRAKYRVSDSVPLINGTINYSPYDIRVSSKLLVGEEETIELDSIPTSSNIVLMSATCTNGAVLTWNSSKNGYEVSNLTKKGTKCEAVYAMMGSDNISNFDYTGEIQEFVASKDGNYLLEVWGAQGGDAQSYTGGYGAYAKGVVNLKQNDTLYIGVGGKGNSNCTASGCVGGYNGGGSGGAYTGDANNYQSGGGGATHIASQTGLLSSLENNKDSILIVSGGGSGAYYHPNGADFSTNGVSGGGIQGNDGIVTGYGMTAGGGGTQTAGGSAGYRGSAGSFGQGGAGVTGATTGGASGGGGGLYGGGAAGHSAPGGGSGYIANSNLSDKLMFCYNCVTSDDVNTLTYSTTNVSDSPLSNTAKEGNGYAKISLLDFVAYQPKFNLEAERGGQNIIVTVTPSEENLFEISKYYYTINDEYIESDSNTYTFEDLEGGDYTVKVYVVDSQGITSEIQLKVVNVFESFQDIILANSTLGTGNPNFANTSCSSGCVEETNGLYTSQDNDGIYYYFRGTVNDNWVKFAGFYWRIIKINSDGSVRMIYSGEGSPALSGAGTQIQVSTFNVNHDYSEYAGLVYARGQQHGYGTNSTIMSALNNWYNNYLSDYSKYLSENASFCSDRNTFGGNPWSSSSLRFYYAAYGRLITNKVPSTTCSVDDILSKSNGKLINPIGLITADEAAMAGIVSDQDNTGGFLYTGLEYWTMTPSYFYNSPNRADVFSINSVGGFNRPGVSSEYGIRPVVNLSSDVAIIGSGTSDDPYVVKGAE